MMKFLILLMLSVIVLSANIGKITGIKGDVTVHRESGDFKGKTGFVLEVHDKITTKVKSKALVLFSDKTSITVGSSSTMSVDDFVYDVQNAEQSKATFKLGKGIFRAITGKVGKLNPSKFALKTKSASMGIRGSEAYIEVDADGTMNVDVLDGIFVAHGKDIPKNSSAKVSSTTMTKFETTEEQKEKVDKFKKDDEKIIVEEVEAQEQEAEAIEDEPEDEAEEVQEGGSVEEDDDFEVLEAEDEEVISIETQVLTDEYVMEETVVNKVAVDAQVIVEDKLDLEVEFEQSDVEEIAYTEIISDSPVSSVEEILVNFSTITKEIVGSDTYMEFGYVLDELEAKTATYITGSLTPNILIDQYILNSNTASYSGDIAALVTDSSGNKVSSSGSINLDMNFGTKNLTGDIAVTEGNWKADINSGNVHSYGFNSTDITSASDSSISDISGKIEGKFYGTQAQSAGGSFNLESSRNGSVNGVFGANK